MLQKLSIKGVVVGSITVIASSIVLSMLMPLFFVDLIKTGKLDVLITSFWPQIYTLGVVLVSGVFGVYISSVVANRASWLNSVGVILVSVLLTYIINKPTSEFTKAYPMWFSVLSYSLCFVSLVIGYFVSNFFITKISKSTPESGLL